MTGKPSIERPPTSRPVPLSNEKVFDYPFGIRRGNIRGMLHPLEAVIREAYAAFGRGNINGYLSSCTPEFTFNVAGRGGICGTWAGQKGLHELAAKAMAISAGTFSEEVEDVLANDRHAVVLARHRFVRDGSSKDYRTAHIYEVRDGKLVRCFEQPRDASAFHDAWGSSEG